VGQLLVPLLRVGDQDPDHRRLSVRPGHGAGNLEDVAPSSRLAPLFMVVISSFDAVILRPPDAGKERRHPPVARPAARRASPRRASGGVGCERNAR
jgi:hypothetical protein